MVASLRHLIRAARHRKWFLATCQANGLQLDYEENEAGIGIFREVFEQRVYADFFPFHENATVIDIGGHFGYFSLFAALQLAEQGRVFTVEPSRQNFDQLQRNLNRNGLVDKVKTFHSALASAAGEKKLFLSKSENHSLFAPVDATTWETVPALTLATLIEQTRSAQVDFLKMDCEGAEYEILLGAAPAVLDRIQTISLEFHDLKSAAHNGLKLAQHLQENGFRIVRFAHHKTTKGNNFGTIVATKTLGRF